MSLAEKQLKNSAKTIRKEKFRKRMLGSAEKRGLIMSTVVYVLLITIAFIYLYPVLYMFSRSLMTRNDLLDASAKWLPSQVTGKNYQDAILTLDYWNSLWKNLVLALLPTICQVFICSMASPGMTSR